MIITRTSGLSGIVREMDLPVTEEQLARWEGGELVQNVFPHLDAGQREFLMTGITTEEWDETFANDEGSGS